MTISSRTTTISVGTTTSSHTPADWKRRLSLISEAVGTDFAASVNRIADTTERPDPFRVLVSTIISLRTRDEVTFAASERLFAAAPDAGALASLPEHRIQELIYPAGFYRNKARDLRRIASLIIERHDGRVPDRREELTAFPGVGRKTANLVLGVGFGIPAICVDIHVHRIPNRLGWVATKTPEQTEQALMAILPQRYWIPINELLVGFGQRVCTPQSPRCSNCPLERECPRVGVTRSR